jgi:hypothetical protein
VAGTSGAGPSQRLFMVIDAPPGTTTKHIVSFNAVSNTAGSSTTNLGENTRIRLAHNPATGHLMLTYEDSYRVGLLEPASNRLINYTHPAQLKPLSIAVAADQRHVYVLNFASNTLSKVPVTRFAPNNQLDLTALVNYRANVLEAYTDLWGGLFQYLKDCFCDHLLVNCPDCDDDDKIYLACVRFRNGQVFKVCNFSGRKYVKSFPTVEYWLSVFPILPLVGKLVEKICCAVFPNLFSRYHAERSTVNENGVKVAESRVSGEQIETGVMFAKQTNFRATIADQMLKLTAGRQVVQESVASAIKERNAAPPPAQDKPSISTNEVTGLKVEEARTKLEAAGVTVEGVEKYEPRSTVRNLARLAINPTRLRPGARITLVEQDGVVRIAEESPAPVRALREELAETKNAVAESREAIARTDALQKEVTELRQQLAEREHVIAELRETTKQFKEHAETLRLLREQVDSIRSVVRIPAPPAQPAKPAPSEHPALTEPPVKPAAGGTVKPAETPDVKPEKPEGGVKPTTRPVIKPRRGGGGGQEPTE